MIGMLLTDSSTLVRFYSKEPGWEGARDYIRLANTIPLALVELSSGLFKKVRKNEMSANIAKELIWDYASSVPLLDQNKYIITAFEIAMKNSLSVYDSLFIAAAEGEGCDLVSCDDRQLKVAS